MTPRSRAAHLGNATKVRIDPSGPALRLGPGDGARGSVNEGKYFNAFPDGIDDNLPLIDELGSPNTYNHYPTGWAVAFSTPFRMFKRYTYQGGVCDPLVISWPKGIRARGEVRDQYHHSTDIYPTILDVCGVPMPEVVNGVKQSPLAGVSMRYSFDDASAPTQKVTQYYEMFEQRGLWHEGWKVVSEHGPMSAMSNFEQDRCQLFHTDQDRAEAHDLAAQYSDRVRELVALWMEEARTNNVLPLNDMAVAGADLQKFLALEFKVPVRPSGQYTYYPSTSEVPERSAANVHGVSYKVLAQVEFDAGQSGRDLRPRLTLRWSRAVRQGWPAHVCVQLPRYPARDAPDGAGAGAGSTRGRRRVHQAAYA